MTTKELLLDEIDQTPEASGSAFETAKVSEAALAKDWLRPEEDEAWRSLAYLRR